MTLREAWTTQVTPEDYENHMARIGQAETNAVLIRELLHPLAGGRVLIAGAGTGQMFDYLPVGFLSDARVTCTDVNAAFLAKLRERFTGDTAIDDIEDSRLEPGWAAIVVVLVLEHVDWRKAVRSLVRLEAEELLVIVQRNPADVTAAVTPGRTPPGTMRVLADEAPPHLVPLDELIAELGSYGYTMERQETRGVPDGKFMIATVFRHKLP